MISLLALVFAILLQLCVFTAQQDVPDAGSASLVEASGSTPLSRPCHEAGYSRCCRGRNDSCLGNPQVCYCDEYCLRSNTEDCCEDLVMGMLRCGEHLATKIHLTLFYQPLNTFYRRI